MEHNDDIDNTIRKQAGNTTPEDNFKVPRSYFDTFSSRVKDSLEARTTQRQKGVSWQALLRPVFAVPAVAAMLVAGYFVFFNNSNPAGNQQATVVETPLKTEEVKAETIEEYLSQHTGLVDFEDEVDETVLMYAIDTDEDIIPQAGNAEVNEDDIEEYLINTADETLFENL